MSPVRFVRFITAGPVRFVIAAAIAIGAALLGGER